MLTGIITLLLFEFLGECLNRLFLPFIPSPIIGMVLLFLFLVLKGSSFKSLNQTVNLFLKYFPVFILPSAVGIITQFEIITKNLYSIIFTICISTILSLAINAKIIDYFISKKGSKLDEL